MDKRRYGYDIDEVAFNYRPNEMSAALAFSHIERIELLIQQRRKLAEIYNQNLNFDFYVKQTVPTDATHVYHLYTLLLPNEDLRSKFLDYLKTKNIFGQIHYPPINKMTGFKKYSSNTPISDDMASRCIYSSILHSTILTRILLKRSTNFLSLLINIAAVTVSIRYWNGAFSQNYSIAVIIRQRSI